jgi:hypothetical protein
LRACYSYPRLSIDDNDDDKNNNNNGNEFDSTRINSLTSDQVDSLVPSDLI